MLFEEFMLLVNKGIFTTFYRAMIGGENQMRERQRVRRVVEQKAEALAATDAAAQQAAAQQAAQQAQEEAHGKPKSGLQPYRREIPKVGRNEPCPCGSGKKYKDCHGSSDQHEPVRHTVGGPEDGE
jgi:uncharacterized protein YecA (UPF0149 family)